MANPNKQVARPINDLSVQWTPVGETNGYECVDDDRDNHNGDTDYITVSAVNKNARVDVEPLLDPGWGYDDVIIYSVVKRKVGQPKRVKLGIINDDDTTLMQSGNKTVNTVYETKQFKPNEQDIIDNITDWGNLSIRTRSGQDIYVPNEYIRCTSMQLEVHWPRTLHVQEEAAQVERNLFIEADVVMQDLHFDQTTFMAWG